MLAFTGRLGFRNQGPLFVLSSSQKCFFAISRKHPTVHSKSSALENASSLRSRPTLPHQFLHSGGIIIVNKPPGIYSNDVVMKVQALLEGQAKVGHGGTLDQWAQGVLVLGIGAGCRQLQSYLKGPKTYVATATMGTSTTTMDRVGEVQETKDYSHVTQELLQSVCQKFTGPLYQTPPIYSAIKHKGQRLSDLARKGVTVQIEPRPIIIYETKLLEFTPPTFMFEVACSGGTYIRKLIYDIAKEMNTVAFMSDLVRTSVSQFPLTMAIPFDKLSVWTIQKNMEQTTDYLAHGTMGFKN